MDPLHAPESQFHQWLREGDLRRAGEWLVLRHADEVLGLCGALVRDRQAAEDLTQDVFQRAFAALSGFRGEASTRTWLLQIARNRCIDHMRAQDRTPWILSDDDHGADALPDEAPLPHDLLDRRAEVEGALARLDEGERALIILRYKNGLEHAELAEAFGLREGTVRMRLSRALAKMRAALVPPAATTTAAARSAAPPLVGSRAPGAPPPPAAAPAPQTTRAGTGDAGLLRRFLNAFGRRPKTSSPDHPLAQFFLRPDPDADRVVESLLQRARQLH